MKRSSISINIIFEDNHLLVVEKPVNVPVQQDSTNDPDILTLLKEDIKTRYEKPGNVFLGLVHRLDRPVGGVMVFAKTSKAASRLSEQIRRRVFGKKYLAVVHGNIEKKAGEYHHFLLKNNKDNIVSVVDEVIVGAREAVLDYIVLDYKDGFSLVKVNLQTGRSHQIRVQFSATGNPLFGDQKYGSTFSKPGQQVALWAYELSFEHPTRKEEMKFISKPKDVYPWSLFSTHCS